MVMPIKLLWIAILTTLLAACSAGRSHYSAGQQLETQHRYEEAMYSYAEASKAEPTTAEYRVRFLATRERAAAIRGDKGDALYAAGRYAEAVVEYQTAAGLNAAQGRYLQKAERAAVRRDAQAAFLEGGELEKKGKMREAARAYAAALELAADNKEFRQAAQRVANMRKSRLDGFELQLKSHRPITLRFHNARLKEVFNVVSQLSGINFIFDEEVKDQTVNINLENATFYQAMDLLAGMHKLGRKILNESTVIIYPRSTEKLKQYEDMVVRTYTMNHLDAKKAINLVRSLVQVRKLYVNEEANTLIIRDTAEIADVVEKILEANDVPDAEVVLDVEVVEVNDKDTRNLGLLLSDYSVSLGGFSPADKLLSPSLFSSASSPVPVDVSQLIKAFSIKGFGGYVTVPNATYNFGKTLARGDVLSNPKIRVKNKEKAKFNVGQRIPIQTTTTTNQTTSVNVQYVDVGVKVNAEPTIQLNNDVSIRLTIEVSSVIKKETAVDKTTLVTIGTRNLETVLSLKDGETSVIGGLIQSTGTENANKVFLLGDLPLIGPLLSYNNNEKDKTELVLAITPRLVRGISVPPVKVASFASGKEDAPTLARPYASFDIEPEYHGDEPKKLLKPESEAAGNNAQSLPVLAPAKAPLPPEAVQKGASVPQSVKASEAGKASVGFVAPSQSPNGEVLVLPVQLARGERLTSARFVVTFDPEMVDFVSASEGGYLKEAGVATTFSGQPGKPGTVAVTASRTAGSPGVSGDGTLAVLTFRAKKAGPAGFGLDAVVLATGGGTPQQAIALSSFVDIN